ncbi:transposase [Nocardioides massiliensis]|uniref:Transposase n=2 Tax=Nocardioides massiliensis TaxID=1325935 RepID=A0ABT9NTR0_9ACTN|nr:IS110 family transposase [Nocardioides massiliensis]MDP9821034.1 transposase [Nocardioides massiliensis]MDP9822502.1 transposase [Nocardioides massiliensis]MDP9823798.1 transposase [Nocardioides massiliensis]
MEVIHSRCAGIDIGKKSAKVCVRVQGSGARATSTEVSDWGSMTREILDLRQYLIAEQVSCVLMESTSDYWKPYYYLLEDAGFELILANAGHVKNIPGRKSDVSDAVWLADLAAHGLVRASFVPPPQVRQLRDLTRTRTIIARERVRETTRLEKRLESPGIKLSVVASNLNGVSARRMLKALVAGERDPEVLADLALGTMRAKRDQLIDALTGRFSDHDAFMIGLHLDRIEQHDQAIATLDERIEVMIEPFRHLRDLLITIPGVSVIVADVIIAETGGDMSNFPSPAHLAAWAGVAPGQNESAGRKKQGTTRPGDSYLKGALGSAALAASKSKNTYLAARYRRIAARRGRLRAIVAIERSILTSVWHMLTDDVAYRDLGADHYQLSHPDQIKRRALKQLRALGLEVELRPAS